MLGISTPSIAMTPWLTGLNCIKGASGKVIVDDVK